MSEQDIRRKYDEQALVEELADLQDQQWLRQHPWAVEQIRRHDPKLLKKIEIPVERGKSGWRGLPVCPVCQGDRKKGAVEFEEVKLNRIKRMLTMWSSYNRQSGDYVYLGHPQTGQIYRYPRSQAEAPDFVLLDAEGNLTKPADGKYLTKKMKKDKDDA